MESEEQKMISRHTPKWSESPLESFLGNMPEYLLIAAMAGLVIGGFYELSKISKIRPASEIRAQSSSFNYDYSKWYK